MDLSKPLTRFLLKSVVLYLGWHLLWYNWIEPDGRLNHYLTYNTAWISEVMINAFSSDTYSLSPFSQENTYLFRNQVPVVLIEHGCNGLILMVLFAAFVIAFPGPWQQKLWYVPAGILAIYLINSLRVIGLALNQIFSKNSFEFNHKYTFTILVYGAIMLFWMVWVNRFSGIQNGGKK